MQTMEQRVRTLELQINQLTSVQRIDFPYLLKQLSLAPTFDANNSRVRQKRFTMTENLTSADPIVINEMSFLDMNTYTFTYTGKDSPFVFRPNNFWGILLDSTVHNGSIVAPNATKLYDSGGGGIRLTFDDLDIVSPNHDIEVNSNDIFCNYNNIRCRSVKSAIKNAGIESYFYKIDCINKPFSGYTMIDWSGSGNIDGSWFEGPDRILWQHGAYTHLNWTTNHNEYNGGTINEQILVDGNFAVLNADSIQFLRPNNKIRGLNKAQCYVNELIFTDNNGNHSDFISGSFESIDTTLLKQCVKMDSTSIFRHPHGFVTNSIP